MVFRKTDVNLSKRVGELIENEVECVITRVRFAAVQDLRLVLEQTEGCRGWVVLSSSGQQSTNKLCEDLDRLKIRDHREQCLLGPSRPRPVHQDHWTPVNLTEAFLLI